MPKQNRFSKHMRYAIHFTLLACIYSVAAKLSLSVAVDHGNVSAVWPPSGIAFAALLMNLRLWPAIAAGTFVTILTTGVSVPTALLVAAGNTLEGVLASVLTARFCGAKNPLKRGSDLFRFILLSVIFASGIGAMIGVVALSATNQADGKPAFELWKTWFTGDALGILIVGSFLVSMKTYPLRNLSWKKTAELAGEMIVAGLCAVIIFNETLFPELSRTYAILPIIVLVSYRFQQAGAASSVFLVAAISIFVTIRTAAKIPNLNLNESLLDLQYFLFITSLTALFLASAISERKEAETDLTWSEQKFRGLSENIPCIAYIAEFGEGGRWIYVNRRVKTILGFSEKEIMDDPGLFKTRIHPEDREKVFNHEMDVQRSGKIFHIEYRFYTKDDRLVWLEDEGIILPGQKAARYYQGIISDISRRKTQEKDLVESRQKYEDLLNSVDGVVWEADPQTFRFTYVSPQAERLVGWPLELWVSQDFWKDHIHPADRNRVIESRTKSIQEGKDHATEYRLLRSGGDSIWVRDIVTAIIEDSKLFSLRGIMIDIHREKEALEALQKSEERYKDFFRDDLTGNFISSRDGSILECNPAFVRMFRFKDHATAIGSNWLSFFNDPAEPESILNSLPAKRKLENLESTLKASDGKLVQVIQNILGSFDSAGSMTQIRGYLLDITERKHLESQLLQSQKMQAIGQLAGGVAHEFNNILMAITGYSELMEAQLEKDHPFALPISEILKASKKGAGLTKQLLAFGKKQANEQGDIDVNQLLCQMKPMLQKLIREDVELILKLGDVGKVKFDAPLLEQIFVNLAVNARDAMPSGGLLVIETESFEMDDHFCRNNLGAVPGKYVQISVTDTGTGMDEAIRSRIFEPFFTTKQKGEGTGLGLAIVYGIVKHSGGYISLTSQVGEGTAFNIYLPHSERQPQPSASENESKPSDILEKLILLVDDSHAVRESIGTFLKLKGFRVILASEGSEAVELAKNNPVDLLITDVVMPHMTGNQLAALLQSTNPNLKILFMSGYTEESILTGLGPNSTFISKPASMKDIIQKIHELFL